MILVSKIRIRATVSIPHPLRVCMIISYLSAYSNAVINTDTLLISIQLTTPNQAGPESLRFIFSFLIFHPTSYAMQSMTIVTSKPRNPSIPPELWAQVIGYTRGHDPAHVWTQLRHVSRTFRQEIERNFSKSQLPKTIIHFFLSKFRICSAWSFWLTNQRMWGYSMITVVTMQE